MITRSLSATPFGLRLTYSMDGENTWTEYLDCSSAVDLTEQDVEQLRWRADFDSQAQRAREHAA